jgi:hypothetical protein
MTKRILNRRMHALPGILAALGATALAVACGGETGADGTGGTNSSDIGAGLDSDGSTGNADFDASEGGKVDLTSEDITAIEQAACTGWAAEGENLPATLELVVDVSFSMTETAPGTNESKWEVTHDALREAVQDLPASVAVGVLYYPNQDVQLSAETQPIDACVNVDEMVPIQQLGEADSDQRNTILDSLDDAQTAGYTPTHDAYQYALTRGLLPYTGSGNQKFMLLITDGAPTMSEGCVSGDSENGNVMDMPTQPIIDEIVAAREQGIRTFLIGSPGSEESSEEAGGDMRPWLSRAAVEGGTAADGCDVDGPNFCHMDMTQEEDFGEALRAGLAAIAGQVIDTCTFAVPEPPNDQAVIDPTLTNLVVTWGSGEASLYLPDNVGACDTGWTFNDAGQVELCPATCDEVKLDEGATVQLTFGCGADVIDVVTK